MQLLFGYLVALTVFLGGGYAGVQWLLTPDDGPALAENSRPESASSRLIKAKKIRDARALHRRQAESLAEAAAPKPVETGVEAPAAQTADQAEPGAHADTTAPESSQQPAKPQTADAAVSASDPKLEARAQAAPVVSAEKTRAAQNEAVAQQKPVARPGSGRVAAKKLVEAKAAPASEPVALHGEAATAKKPSVARKPRAERVASSSRKPVMMILRTIEFPDGRREQRLLPMTQARAGSVRYGSVSAFADDDDF